MQNEATIILFLWVNSNKFILAMEVLVTAYAFGCENDCLEDYMLKFYARFGNEN